MHLQGGAILIPKVFTAIQIECAAVHGFVPADRAGGQDKSGVFSGQTHRTAVLTGRVIADRAAAHGRLTVIGQINRAAGFFGIISGKIAAGEGECGVIQVQCAAVRPIGSIPGEGAAGHGHLPVIVHGDGTASGASLVVGKCAAFDIHRAAADRIQRTTKTGSIVFDRAAVDIYGAAIYSAAGCVIIKNAIYEDRSAIAGGLIVGELAAVHMEDTVFIVQRNGAAASGCIASGDSSSIHIHRAFIEVDAHSAPAGGCCLNGAAACAVAEDELGIFLHHDLRGAVAC